MSSFTVTITYADSTTKVVSGTAPATDTNTISEVTKGIERQIATGKLLALVAPYTVQIVVT